MLTARSNGQFCIVSSQAALMTVCLCVSERRQQIANRLALAWQARLGSKVQQAQTLPRRGEERAQQPLLNRLGPQQGASESQQPGQRRQSQSTFAEQVSQTVLNIDLYKLWMLT